ncbi:hypothetical protein Micbo1qcDRAFT_226619 [Microdochium bolleyi]|uniref:Uncharacterized protein n=1 Tax=Microdochium bolleyi TaxID=196109 RepID=A0A136J0P5_9PEZI|nr:hypothetical protein Micbo1qcDRAFT_226619 [Microdochium bolleyi]
MAVAVVVVVVQAAGGTVTAHSTVLGILHGQSRHGQPRGKITRDPQAGRVSVLQGTKEAHRGGSFFNGILSCDSISLKLQQSGSRRVRRKWASTRFVLWLGLVKQQNEPCICLGISALYRPNNELVRGIVFDSLHLAAPARKVSKTREDSCQRTVQACGLA